MKKPRDFQKQKVYDWEDKEVRHRTNRVIDFEHAQQFVDGVWLSLGLMYPPKVDLMASHATRIFATGCRGRLQLRMRTPAWIILHELAHALTCTEENTDEGHGADFVGMYLKLLDKVLNIPLPLLLYSLEKTGIKYNLAVQPKFVNQQQKAS